MTAKIGLLGQATRSVGLWVHSVGLSVCRTIARRNIEMTPIEIGTLKEDIEFALSKLKSLTEQICSIADVDECEESKKLYDENSEQEKNILYL